MTIISLIIKARLACNNGVTYDRTIHQLQRCFRQTAIKSSIVDGRQTI